MKNIEAIVFNRFELQKLLKRLSFDTGIDFHFYRENFVQKRVKSRMIRLNLTTARDYLEYLDKDSAEIEKFKSGFTINTSYLFRNRDVFEKLAFIFNECLNAVKQIGNGGHSRNGSNSIALLKSHLFEKDRHKIQELLPQLSIYRKLKSHVNSPSTFYIWSCACASGEEPYSLAIMLDDFRKNRLNFPQYKITASDIDKVVLGKADRGLYIDEAIREVPKLYELKYFKKIKDKFGPKYSISNGIKEQVEFIQEDVTKGHKKPYKYDIIFCRYFLIYTDKVARDRILNILESNLAYGGLLVLGKTETLFNSRYHLKLIDSRNHIYLKTNFS